MLKRVIAYIYEYYSQGKKKGNLLTNLHRKIFSSRFLFETLFKVRTLSHWEEKGEALFDLTTILLRHELKKKMGDNKNLKLFELGVGSGAPLSGYFSGFTDHPVVTCDINPQIVSIARRNIEANNLNIQVYVSDAFDSIPEQNFDLLWWNLPYDGWGYENPEQYLFTLFNDAPRFMTLESFLVIGFNCKPLPVERLTRDLKSIPFVRNQRTVQILVEQSQRDHDSTQATRNHLI